MANIDRRSRCFNYHAPVINNINTPIKKVKRLKGRVMVLQDDLNFKNVPPSIRILVKGMEEMSNLIRGGSLFSFLVQILKFFGRLISVRIYLIKV